MTWIIRAWLALAFLATPVAAQQPADPVAPARQQRDEQQALMREDLARELALRVPLQVQVVLSRYQGEKKVASLPYTVSVNANDAEPSRLRMGARVPVSMMAGQQKLGMPAVGPVTYQDIGTNIDASVRNWGNGTFEVVVSIEENSIYANVQEKATPESDELPVFRSFQSKNTLILKDGQSRQFTAATDRISGETVRVDVTLTVVK